MKAVVFSRRAKPPLGSRRRAPGPEWRPLAGMKRQLPGLEPGVIAYVDARGMPEKALARLLAVAVAAAPGRVGVLDVERKVKDPAALLHAGAVDYVGGAGAAGRIDAGRLAAVSAFAARLHDAPGPVTRDAGAPSVPAGPLSADPWAGIVDGTEHRFAFLFVEADDAEDMKKRYAPAAVGAAMETFRAWVERTAAPHGGRPWMWTRFGGLVLFPLRGPEPAALLCALKLLLGRVFFDAEESPLPGRLSFRMALSVGTTTWRARDTGRIVSDAVNSIFHLGRRMAAAGQFIVTADAAASAPESLRAYLVPAGTFESRKVLRFLRPVPGEAP